ncbi:MAG: phosphatidate cytidylyltransferase [Chlamydiales bacterium]|nr:phosphatidate cytidylyltransferase [Chlamydiales bacterium]
MSGKKKMGDLRYRIPILSFVTLLVAFFIFLGEYHPMRWVFTAFAAGVASIALFEYYMLVRQKGLTPAITWGIIATVLYIFALFFKTQGPHHHWDALWQKMPEIVLGVAFFGCFVRFAWSGKEPILNIATSFLGIVYLAVPFGMFVRIMYFFVFDGMEDPHFQGAWWILYLVAVTKSADMGGYFVGRFAGRRKLAFKISPNKTFEGALGGLLSSVIISLVICSLGKRFGHVFVGFSYVSSIWLGILIGILGQIGDLAESLLKRDADVKDSNTLPAVGGILDMTDSILFTSPVVYIFLRVLYA